MVKSIVASLKNILRFIKTILSLSFSRTVYGQKERVEEGVKTIYKGASKLLNKNSREYKEIDEKNSDAWKKLAEL